MPATSLNLNRLKICSRLELSREAWDTFVDSCDQAWLWHRFDLQAAIATWPRKRDISFAVLEEGSPEKILAVVPLHMIEYRELRFIPWIVLDSLGGPACANLLEEKQNYHLVKFIMERIIEIAEKSHAVEIGLALSPMAPAYRGERCPLVNPLLEMGLDNKLTQTWVVALKKGEAAIWDGMEKRARTAIRKAEKSGVSIRLANGPEDLDSYYELHRETYHRTGVRPHPKAYFEAIWRDFITHGFAWVFLAMHEGEVVAAESFGVFKEAAVYWTGAASKKGLSLQANSLIQWSAIRQMLAHGLKWYETGEAFPGIYEGKLKGLNDFKRSFGGDLYPIYRGGMISGKRLYGLKQSYRFLREAIKG